MMNGADKLAGMLRQDGMVVAPGGYDCITARMIEQGGFEAAYMTGAGTAASLGYPDYGLVTMTEMVENAGRMASVLNIPLIADADTGYGNELNVVRTIREYEKRGVAGIHLEDQGFPKRCGHLDNKEIIPLDDYIAKIRAAVSAKENKNFTIIARTDSRAVLGFEEAIRRANAALDAGADVAFVEAPQSEDEVRQVPKLVHGPCFLNIVWKGKTPNIPLEDAKSMGYKIAILPGLLFKAVMSSCDEILAATKREGKHPAPAPGGKDMTVREAFARVGANEWDPFRTQFREPLAQAAE